MYTLYRESKYMRPYYDFGLRDSLIHVFAKFGTLSDDVHRFKTIAQAL